MASVSNTTASVGVVSRLAQHVVLAEGWRAALMAVVAGALTTLALAPFHAMPVIFLTLPVLVWLMDGALPPAGASGILGPFKRLWPAFRTGWLFGFGYFLAGFWWVGVAFLVDADEFVWLLPFAVLALPAGLALFWGVATALARLAWTDNRKSVGWVRILALCCALAFMEWVRGTALTGLPWNAIGYTIQPSPLFMQASSLIGLYGMGFVALVMGTMVLVGLAENRWLLVLPLLLVVAQPAYGLYRLAQATDDTVPNVRLRLVQPALDQREKWEPAKEAEIMQRYLSLSDSDKGPKASSVSSFTHVLWPESAFPFILTSRLDQLTAIASFLPPETTLITGAMRLEAGGGDPKVYNSLFVMDDNAQILEARDKTRLLPFGEFLPFQQTLEDLGFQQLTKLRGGFEPGRRRSTVELPSAPPFLPLICYEIIFSGKVQGARSASGNEPRWIVNVTNDAWFGMTTGPYQHAHQAQVRAVEEGLPVVRVANNGISMVVDAHGRVLEKLALGARGVVDSDLPEAIDSTLFARWGNAPSVLFVCVFFLILVGVRAANTNRL